MLRRSIFFVKELADNVLRGGAWLHARQFARCAFRYNDLPRYFNDFVGVRLARWSPPA